MSALCGPTGWRSPVQSSACGQRNKACACRKSWFVALVLTLLRLGSVRYKWSVLCEMGETSCCESTISHQSAAQKLCRWEIF